MDAKDSIPKPFTTQLGILPSDRALGTRPFQATGTDFADPVMYRNKNRREKKETSFNMQFNKSNQYPVNAKSNYR